MGRAVPTSSKDIVTASVQSQRVFTKVSQSV